MEGFGAYLSGIETLSPQVAHMDSTPCLEPTYQGLKQAIGTDALAQLIVFGAYLSGIETWDMPARHSPLREFGAYLSGIETRPRPPRPPRPPRFGAYLSGIETMFILNPPPVIVRVWSLPIRD